jgi:hypothetical protein
MVQRDDSEVAYYAAFDDAGPDHATFITERAGEGFVVRCLCGWRNSAAGYDYQEAIDIESTHPGPTLEMVDGVLREVR